MQIRYYLIIAALIALVIAPLTTQANEEIIGTQAPEIMLKGVDGKPYRLSQYRGKTVVLEWVNYRCPFVTKRYSLNIQQSLQKRFVPTGVVWLQIVSSAPGKMGYITEEEGQKALKDNKAHVTALLRDEDGAVAKAYGVRKTPEAFVISPEGIIAYNGPIYTLEEIVENNRVVESIPHEHLRDAISSVQKGEPVEMPYKRVLLGCNLKR